MALNVKFNTPTCTTIQTPCLMVDPESSLIVLLSDWASGICLAPGKTKYNVGYYTNQWKMHKLIPYNGKIELENKA